MASGVPRAPIQVKASSTDDTVMQQEFPESSTTATPKPPTPPGSAPAHTSPILHLDVSREHDCEPWQRNMFPGSPYRSSNTRAIVRSLKPSRRGGRAYAPHQVPMVAARQTAPNALATLIAHAAGLRAHELLTLARLAERPPDVRPARPEKFDGRPGTDYTVVGKGGLARLVRIPDDLAERLEKRRLDHPGTGHRPRYPLPVALRRRRRRGLEPQLLPRLAQRARLEPRRPRRPLPSARHARIVRGGRAPPHRHVLAQAQVSSRPRVPPDAGPERRRLISAQ